MNALEVITGALRLLGVRAAESPITDAEAQDGLESLNDMLNEWEQDGISLGFESVDDVDDDLYIDDAYAGAIKANLAVYIAPEYNRLVSDALAFRAKKGKRAARSSIPLECRDYPDSLPVGSGNEYNYSPDGDAPGNVNNGRFYPARKKCN